MGQSSSQVASEPVSSFEDGPVAQEADAPSLELPESQPELQIDPQADPQPEPRPKPRAKPGQKAKPAPWLPEVPPDHTARFIVPAPKRRATPKEKKSSNASAKQSRRGRRAVPQHTRGTSILPRIERRAGSPEVVIEHDPDAAVGVEYIEVDLNNSDNNLARMPDADMQPIPHVDGAGVEDEDVVMEESTSPKKSRKRKQSAVQFDEERDAIEEDQSRKQEVQATAPASRERAKKAKTKEVETQAEPGAGEGDPDPTQVITNTPASSNTRQGRLKRPSKSPGGAAQVETAPRDPSHPPTPSDSEEGVKGEHHGRDEATASHSQTELHDEPNEEASAPSTAKAKRKKRQQKPSAVEDQAEEAEVYELEPDSENEQGRKSKRPRQSRHSNGPVRKGFQAASEDSRPSAMRQFNTAERGKDTGKWTDEERQRAHDVLQEFCDANGIPEAQLKLRTTDWSHLGEFKNELYYAFPRRTIQNIRKVCQRMFSPYGKGAWSEEETQRLKDAYAKYPDQWPLISKEVERSSQSCQVHWQDQVMYADKMDKGPWSVTEEEKLLNIVEKLIATIEENVEDPNIRNDRTQIESFIDWDEVAKQMAGKRSRKRCYEKWNTLKRRQGKENEAADKKPPPSSTRKRTRKSETFEWTAKEYAEMNASDVHAALYELLTAINVMPHTDFRDETTFWSVVWHFRQEEDVFHTSLLRHVYLRALETYDCKKVQKAQTYRTKVTALIKRMSKLAKKGDVVLGERSYGLEHAEPSRRRRVADGVPKEMSAQPDEDDQEGDRVEDEVRTHDDPAETPEPEPNKKEKANGDSVKSTDDIPSSPPTPKFTAWNSAGKTSSSKKNQRTYSKKQPRKKAALSADTVVESEDEEMPDGPVEEDIESDHDEGDLDLNDPAPASAAAAAAAAEEQESDEEVLVPHTQSQSLPAPASKNPNDKDPTPSPEQKPSVQPPIFAAPTPRAADNVDDDDEESRFSTSPATLATATPLLTRGGFVERCTNVSGGERKKRRRRERKRKRERERERREGF